MAAGPPTLIEWDGVTIAITYDPKWLEIDGPLQSAHIELRVSHPSGAKLPVTDTGYRSHFCSKADIEAAGGPEPFVKLWLDEEAKRPEWKRVEEKERQLDLFN